MYFQCLGHTYYNYTFKLCVANKLSLLWTSNRSGFPCLPLSASGFPENSELSTAQTHWRVLYMMIL